MINPMQFAQQMITKNVNPMQKNALEMIINNDEKGLEQLARNICKERGIDVDEALKKINGGMR